MKIATLLPFVLLLAGVPGFGQQLHPDVLASAGTQQFSTDHQAYLSFTVGETAIQTLTVPNVSLGQGFHQKALLVVSTENPQLTDWELNVFPNPVGATLYVRYASPVPGAVMTAQIVNALGQILSENQTLTDRNNNAVSVEMLPSGSYYLSLKTDSGRQVSVPFIKASND